MSCGATPFYRPKMDSPRRTTLQMLRSVAGTRRATAWCVVRRMFLTALVFLVAAGIATADDSERIEGIITAVHQNDFVLDSAGRKIVVDMSSLGGITAAIAEGQAIAVIGKMAPDGQKFIAGRLESATKGR